MLARLLERGPQVEHAITRARALAALHHAPAMATKLAAALSVEPRRRRAAA
jgi:hypothetical protein